MNVHVILFLTNAPVSAAAPSASDAPSPVRAVFIDFIDVMTVIILTFH